MTSTYNQIVATANHAATHIGKGMLSTAAKELSRALAVNRKVLIDLGGDLSTSCTAAIASSTNHIGSTARGSIIIPLYHREHPNRLVPSSTSCHQQQVCFASDASLWQNEQGDDDVCGDFVYRRVMLIPVNGQQEYNTKSPLQLHVDVSMVILFNLSLCHHLAGLNKAAGTPMTRRNALQKACALYNVLQTFLTRDQEDLGSRMLLLLASVNNLGQIFNFLGDTTSGEACSLWMLSTLVLLTSSSHWEDQTNGIDLAQFHKNTTHLVLNSPHTAQAA